MGNGGFGGHHHEAFTSFFGDFFGGGHEESDEVPKGANIIVDLYATLEEVIKIDANSLKKWYYRPIMEILSKFVVAKRCTNPHQELGNAIVGMKCVLSNLEVVIFKCFKV
jgi:hypothetical protein